MLSTTTYDKHAESEFYALDNYLIELINQTQARS